jgi:hypothetical protein
MSGAGLPREFAGQGENLPWGLNDIIIFKLDVEGPSISKML